MSPPVSVIFVPSVALIPNSRAAPCRQTISSQSKLIILPSKIIMFQNSGQKHRPKPPAKRAETTRISFSIEESLKNLRLYIENWKGVLT